MTDAAATQIFHDAAHDRAPKLGWYASRVAIYGVLIFWAIICLFPIYWTITTSFKMAPGRDAGAHDPLGRFHAELARAGDRSACRPTPSAANSTVRDEFLKRFMQLGDHLARRLDPGGGARQPGGLWAVALLATTSAGCATRTSRSSSCQPADPAAGRARPALPRALQGAGASRHADRADPALHADRCCPSSSGSCATSSTRIPTELEEAALVDGLSIWGAFLPHHPADRAARHGGGLHPVAGADLERVFLRRAADLDPRQHAAGDGGQPDRQPGDQLVVDGGALALPRSCR